MILMRVGRKLVLGSSMFVVNIMQFFGSIEMLKSSHDFTFLPPQFKWNELCQLSLLECHVTVSIGGSWCAETTLLTGVI